MTVLLTPPGYSHCSLRGKTGLRNFHFRTRTAKRRCIGRSINQSSTLRSVSYKFGNLTSKSDPCVKNSIVRAKQVSLMSWACDWSYTVRPSYRVRTVEESRQSLLLLSLGLIFWAIFKTFNWYIFRYAGDISIRSGNTGELFYCSLYRVEIGYIVMKRTEWFVLL